MALDADGPWDHAQLALDSGETLDLQFGPSTRTAAHSWRLVTFAADGWANEPILFSRGREPPTRDDLVHWLSPSVGAATAAALVAMVPAGHPGIREA